MKNILMIGNLLFIKISTSSTLISTVKDKYMAVSVGGKVFISEIYTYEEIVATWPLISQYDNLMEAPIG